MATLTICGQEITIPDGSGTSGGGGDTSALQEQIDALKEVDTATQEALADRYTKDEVDAIVNAIDVGEFEVVDELPSEGVNTKIYLVAKEDNTYDRYVYINDQWINIGDTEVDLSGYATTEAMNTALDGKADKSDTYTKEEVDEKLADKANADDVYTKTAVDIALDGKQDTLTKAAVLELLGYKESTITVVDGEGETTTVNILEKEA